MSNPKKMFRPNFAEKMKPVDKASCNFYDHDDLIGFNKDMPKVTDAEPEADDSLPECVANITKKPDNLPDYAIAQRPETSGVWNESITLESSMAHSRYRKQPSRDLEMKIFIPSVDKDPDVVPPCGGSERDDLTTALENINVYFVDVKTLVMAVVVNVKDTDKNCPLQVRAKGSVPLKGLPYNNATDTYTVLCVEVADLGAFAFGMRMEVKDAGNFSLNIPIPGVVLERRFSTKHKEIIKNLKTRYPEPTYKIQYLQMIEA